MNEITANVNWLAVIVGMILSMGLGFVWFNPKSKLGKIWAEGVGVGLSPPEKFPALAMGMNTLGLFLMSWFVGVTATNNALLTVILATVAFAMLNGAHTLFNAATKGAAAVAMSYWLVALLLMIASQGLLG